MDNSDNNYIVYGRFGYGHNRLFGEVQAKSLEDAFKVAVNEYLTDCGVSLKKLVEFYVCTDTTNNDQRGHPYVVYRSYGYHVDPPRFFMDGSRFSCLETLIGYID